VIYFEFILHRQFVIQCNIEYSYWDDISIYSRYCPARLSIIQLRVSKSVNDFFFRSWCPLTCWYLMEMGMLLWISLMAHSISKPPCRIDALSEYWKALLMLALLSHAIRIWPLVIWYFWVMCVVDRPLSCIYHIIQLYTSLLNRCLVVLHVSHYMKFEDH